MKSKIHLALRILLGLPMIVFGLNKFLMFLPQPEMTGPAGNFMMALAQSGYMFPLIALVEIVAGALLVWGRYQALALVILLPVTLNIVLFHLFLAPEGMVVGLVLLALNIYLAVPIWKAYKPMLSARPHAL